MKSYSPWFYWFCILTLLAVAGCDVARHRLPPADVEVVQQLAADFGSAGQAKSTVNIQGPRFRMNHVFAHKLENRGAELSEAIDEAQNVLTAMFGTPDQPRMPAVIAGDSELSSLVSIDNLQRAAGAVASDRDGTNRGLYRKHCSACHGLSGDGHGPTSTLQSPYPRDFRMGVFKFKKTSNGAKPTRSDLVDTLRRGHPGTAMPSFALLAEEDVDALVDYVIYLTLRGEVERAMYRDAADIGYGDADLPPEERLIAPQLKASDATTYQQQLENTNAYAKAAAKRWQAADESVVAIASRPEKIPAFPLPANPTDDQLAEMLASIARGKALFAGKVANCAVCHGEGGNGDGEVNDYDNWTKEWTMRNGLDPKDPAKKPIVDEFVRLGAHRPRNILPRNMTSGAFRGGSRPEDIYRRIVQGIDGTPMPAINLVEAASGVGLTSGDAWDIVHYVLSLSQPITSSATADDVSSQAGESL